MSKKKSVPLPCDDIEYKTIKMYCLVNGLKYADLTKLLIKVIEGKEQRNENNTV